MGGINSVFEIVLRESLHLNNISIYNNNKLIFIDTFPSVPDGNKFLYFSDGTGNLSYIQIPDAVYINESLS